MIPCASNDMKQSDTLSSYKRKIKTRKGEECDYRLCRPFVAQVGFLSGYICLFPKILVCGRLELAFYSIAIYACVYLNK